MTKILNFDELMRFIKCYKLRSNEDIGIVFHTLDAKIVLTEHVSNVTKMDLARCFHKLNIVPNLVHNELHLMLYENLASILP